MSFRCCAGFHDDVQASRQGSAYKYYGRQVAVGDGRRPQGKGLEEADLPPGVWMVRALPAVGLVPGARVTEWQIRNLFGEGLHPDAGPHRRRPSCRRRHTRSGHARVPAPPPAAFDRISPGRRGVDWMPQLDWKHGVAGASHGFPGSAC
ncbi:relaxase domain-containing protein [Streptomyces sp. NPDC059757]|uniref:relaxase domain-containing protein n=1 Tax=Streptomyces sp. NPDC059757 TaxID=3346935 RepID=UPI003659BBE9